MVKYYYMKDIQSKPKNLSYHKLLEAYSLLQKKNDELQTSYKELEVSNKQLEASNKKLVDEVKQLEIVKKLSQEKIEYLTKLVFGRKAEQKSQIDSDGFHQTSLFDEVDVTDRIQEIDEEIETIKVASHERKARKRKDLRDTGLPEVVIEHKAEVPAGISKYYVIGYDETRRLVYKPAEMYVQINRYQVIKYFDENKEPVIVTARGNEPAMLKGTIASPELVSAIIHDKFVMHNPLYRQEEEYKRRGIGLSRMDLCNYISKFAKWVKPLHQLIADAVKGADNVRADETTLNVIELNGTKARLERNGKAKSYVWLFATAEGHKRAFDYVLGPGRDYAVPRNYFPPLGQSRYLQSDGYEAYSCLESSDRWINIPCLAHIRRKFAEIVQLDGKLTSEGAKYSDSILGYIGLIYQTDKSIHNHCGNDYSKIKEERIIKLKPMFDKLFSTCESLITKALPKSKFAGALTYAINRKEGMMNLFLDGRITLDNNYAEREGIKDLVIGRKNWLFANTKAGATITCEMFSLIQSAIANDLDPYRYVVYLINELPEPTTLGFDYSKYLPWSDSIPDDIKMKK